MILWYTNRVSLHFKDQDHYDEIATTIDAATDPESFLMAYEGLLELDFGQKNIFAFEIVLNKDNNSAESSIKLEAISTLDGETIGIRDSIISNTPLITKSYLGENINKVRYFVSGGFLKSFAFETYDDFLASRDSNSWQQIENGFALSLDDQEVYQRLEHADKPIDNLWPHFNEGTRIRSQNYKDKWNVSYPTDPSIKDLVEDYLAYSETDPRATGELEQENPDPEQENQVFLVSYLDMLNLQALDYHLARMLGLGYIDKLPPAEENQKFVYRIRYSNKKEIGSTGTKAYSYLSLPTGKSNARLPEKPQIRALSYSLPRTDEQTFTAFDEQGYSMVSDVRMVNIGRAKYSFEQEEDDFFEDSTSVDTFNIFEKSKPVLYGIEYRSSSQQRYVKPEITNENSEGHQYYDYDDDYPNGGLPETAPVPDDTESLYVHLEKQPGVHFYAIYGINLFSRVSLRSDEVATDETVFTKQNTLLPPSDMAVQYIQKEQTLLFTTQREQDWLAGRSSYFPTDDTSFTRICFNWLDIMDISHLQDDTGILAERVVKADRIKLFFRQEAPSELKGIVSAIQEVEGQPQQLILFTNSYESLAGAPITPITDETAIAKYVNAVLTTDSGQFRVIAIGQGTNPNITIEKIKDTENVEDEEEPGSFIHRDYDRSPVISSRFTITENLSKPANWQALENEILLADFSDPQNAVIESVSDSEGNITSLWVGGITGNALITPLNDGTEDIPGFYSITYDAGINLPTNLQTNLPFDASAPEGNDPRTLQMPYVEWYKGLLRVPLADESDKVLLEVNRIVQTNPLVLYVSYPGYQNSPLKISSGAQDKIQGVNFHPGYRAYIYTEPLPNIFNRTNIDPTGQDMEKKTMMALQSVDARVGGSGFTSLISSPAILMSRKVLEPQMPEKPQYFGLKVRPDALGKASFTFDVGIPRNGNGTSRNPFGFHFYRTSNEDILRSLYSSQTIVTLLEGLSALTSDDFYDQRFLELADVVFDETNNGHFKVYPAEPAPFGFPDPDKEGLTMQGDSIDLKKEKYQEAIRSTLLPLTEQVPIYAFIKSGQQTKNETPVIRDVNGNLLVPSNPTFNPYPMIRKYSNQEGYYIRFTDYSLGANSRFLYFYAAAETTEQLVAGSLSPFAGPVQILKTSLLEKPLIRSLNYHQLGAEGKPEVGFNLSPVSENDAVSSVRIYRTRNPEKTSPPEAMESFMDAPFDNEILDLQVVDTFQDLTVVPYGEMMYYRLAFISFINNEDHQQEEISSPLSDVIAVKLIDATNPQAPELSYDNSNNRLVWEPTIFKGTYYLYKQNNSGNWNHITKIESDADDGPMSYDLTEPLATEDEDGDPIYHRFKVKVENASGLFNLIDEEITI